MRKPLLCRLNFHLWEEVTRIIGDIHITGYFCARCNEPANPEAYWRVYGHKFGPVHETWKGPTND